LHAIFSPSFFSLFVIFLFETIFLPFFDIDAAKDTMQTKLQEQSKLLDDVNTLKDSTNDLAAFSKNTFKKSTAKKVQQQLKDANEDSSSSTKQDGKSSENGHSTNSSTTKLSSTTSSTTRAEYVPTERDSLLDHGGKTSLASSSWLKTSIPPSFQDSNAETRRRWVRKVIIIVVILIVVLIVVALSIALPLILL
jgi:hypothetical protein